MRIAVNDTQINYEMTGRPDGKVVMLSHSLATSLELWTPQMAALEPHYRVVRYDTRGHGDSDVPPGPYSLEQMADDAAGLMDALGIGAVHFVGISMGGMIGQILALRHPERLRSLVLSDTTATIPADAQPAWKERIEAVRRKGMQAVVTATLERWFTEAYREAMPPEVKRIRDLILSTPPEGFIACSEAIRRLDCLERLSEVDTPALILVGEQDPGTPVSDSEAIHGRIRDSKLKVIPSAAHLCNVEQADVFNDLLLRFLQSH